MNDLLISPGELDDAQRELLVEQFRHFVEQATTSPWIGDEAVEGAPTKVDLATLLAEMTVLKNELRLQSRHFRNTLDELRRFGNDLRESAERQERELERAREQVVAVERHAARPLLLALLDLRDRLQAGAEAAERLPSSFLSRLVPGPKRLAASLAEGQRLTLQRIDDLLAGYRVRPITVEQRPFDPQHMRVAGIEAGKTGDSVADGTVLREVRRGYYYDNELLRAAEVIVSKKANVK